MPAKSQRIKLSEDERHELEAIRDRNHGSNPNIIRAVALLLSDEGPHGPGLKDGRTMVRNGARPVLSKRPQFVAGGSGFIEALQQADERPAEKNQQLADPAAQRPKKNAKGGKCATSTAK